MTNEEIAVRIQQGETGLYSLLWERVEKLVTLLAGRYYARSQVICARSGLELEDLIQAGYFAMLDTVKSFDHKTGYKLTTYLNRHLLNQWAQMLGVKHGREKFDPLNRCISLESPIAGENEDIALGDVIPDKAAEQAIESSFERVYTQQLHDVLESCLDTLKPHEADTIRGRFYRGEKLKEIAERQGCTFQYIRVQESNALRGLRRAHRGRALGLPCRRRRLRAPRGPGPARDHGGGHGGPARLRAGAVRPGAGRRAPPLPHRRGLRPRPARAGF